MVMRNLIKRILKEGTEPQLDKIITILLKKYPNPMEDLMGGIKYLKEIGFDNEEVSKVFRYYLKGMFANHPTLNIYYQVFDSIFRIDDLKSEFEVVYDDDEYGDEIETEDQNHMIFNLWDVNDEYGDPTQVMNWYDVGYWDDYGQGRIMNTTKAPYLDIDNDYLDILKTLFGVKWKGPFKKWFEDRFDLKVKTIG
jgi:hypothetical protein